MEYTYEAMEFGIRLRNIRKKRGYTQERLSEKLYLSTDSISNYEKRKNHMYARTCNENMPDFECFC